MKVVFQFEEAHQLLFANTHDFPARGDDLQEEYSSWWEMPSIVPAISPLLTGNDQGPPRAHRDQHPQYSHKYFVTLNETLMQMDLISM